MKCIITQLPNNNYYRITMSQLSITNAFKQPKIGVAHFKSRVKEILAENNTLTSSVCDIVDNIYGIAQVSATPANCSIVVDYYENQLYKITISDDIEHGFRAILSEGIDNPINMGHIRNGHENDNESSEFGIGLKKSIIFLARLAEIYTRSVDVNENVHFVKVTIDIPAMSNCVDAADSYEPNIEIITEDYFLQQSRHPYKTGSTIILSNLRSQDISHDKDSAKSVSIQDYNKSLHQSLSKIYSDVIKKNIIEINLNGTRIDAIPDIEDKIPSKNIVKYILYCEINDRKEPINIYREDVSSNSKSSIKKYHADSSSFKQNDLSADEFKIFSLRKSVQTIGLTSYSTKNTPFEHTVQSNNTTEIIRDGRFYDQVKITKQEKDGYSNHITNKIEYKTKKLNLIIGVGSNKRVTIKNNILMSAINVTQRSTAAKFRKLVKDSISHDPESDTDREEPSQPINTNSTPKPAKGKAKPKPISKSKPKTTSTDPSKTPVSSNPFTNPSAHDPFGVTHAPAPLQETIDELFNLKQPENIGIEPAASHVIIEDDEENEDNDTDSIVEEQPDPELDATEFVFQKILETHEDSQEVVVNIVTVAIEENIQQDCEDNVAEDTDPLIASLNKIISRTYNSWDEFWEINGELILLKIK